MEQLNLHRNSILILFILLFTNLKSQDRRIYITNDTIIFENPIVVSNNQNEGFFILEEENLKKDYDKMVLSPNTYIYIYNIYDYIEEINMEMLNNDFYTCEFSSLDFSKNIAIRKLNNNVKNFRVGYIELNYYIEKSISTNEKKTYFKKTKDKVYLKFIIANCSTTSHQINLTNTAKENKTPLHESEHSKELSNVSNVLIR